jgi:uncharacterized protein YbaR (Trm112 family)
MNAESNGGVAQSVEQRPFKPVVAGSSPAAPTILAFLSVAWNGPWPMIDPEFLAFLVCPTTRQPLREATDAELAAANAAIGQGQVRNRGGNPVSCSLSLGLVTTDGSWLYPVQDGIPILLSSEAISVSEGGP